MWVVYGIAAVALAYAVVAFWEYATRDLIFNTQLLEANQIKPYFRVNSLFHDPNVLGRYLALVVVVLGACIAWSRAGLQSAAALGTGLVLLAALVLTFSQTSVTALLAGLIVLAWLRYGVRWGLVAGAVAVLVLAAVFVFIGGGGDQGPARSFNKETAGRVSLVEGGLRARRGPPALRLGIGGVRARLLRRDQEDRGHDVPLRADHGRRRAGGDRVRVLRGAAGR